MEERILELHSQGYGYRRISKELELSARYVRQVLAANKPQKENDKKETYEIRANGRIFVNRKSRTVTTDLGEFGEVTFSFEQHASMLRRYSDEWESTRETIPEIARDFDLHPRAFNQYKSIHGWTHAHDPFTDLEWEDGLETERAVDLTIQSHRRAYHRRLEQEKLEQVKADAERWRRFEASVFKPLSSQIETLLPAYTYTPLVLKKPKQEFDLVYCPMDVHFGKFSHQQETGYAYSREKATSLIEKHLVGLLEKVSQYGQPSSILTAIGSDWFNIDTDKGTTTSGTSQDNDGTPGHILWDGLELAVAQINLLRQVAPVHVVLVPGNHDRLLGVSLLHSIRSWFNNASDVTVEKSFKPRQYVQRGRNLIGFAHGDSIRLNDLPLIMASEAPNLWGASKNRMWFTGHLHHEVSKDIKGTMIYQLPSLSPADRYHALHGHTTARKSLVVHLIDRADGVIGTFLSTEEV